MKAKAARSGPLTAALLLGACGCVSMGKYKALESRESRASQSLQRTQALAQKTAESLKESQAREKAAAQSLEKSKALNAALKKDNEKLSSSLAAVRKKISELVSGLKADLSQAQKDLASALKRVEESGGSPAVYASSAPRASVSKVPPSVSVSTQPAGTP